MIKLFLNLAKPVYRLPYKIDGQPRKITTGYVYSELELSAENQSSKILPVEAPYDIFSGCLIRVDEEYLVQHRV